MIKRIRKTRTTRPSCSLVDVDKGKFILGKNSRTASTLGRIFYSMSPCHSTQQVAPLLSAFRGRNNRKPPTETADQSPYIQIQKYKQIVLQIVVNQSGAHKFRNVYKSILIFIMFSNIIRLLWVFF